MTVNFCPNLFPSFSFFFFFFIFLHLIIKEDAWSLKGHVWRVFNDVSFTLGRIIRNVLAD